MEALHLSIKRKMCKDKALWDKFIHLKWLLIKTSPMLLKMLYLILCHWNETNTIKTELQKKCTYDHIFYILCNYSAKLALPG